MNLNLNSIHKFEKRHIGPSVDQINKMLEVVDVNDLDELIAQTIPESIKIKKSLNLPIPQTEPEFVAGFKKIAGKNKMFKSYIGLG
jgi:glycine dehydrogenase